MGVACCRYRTSAVPVPYHHTKRRERTDSGTFFLILPFYLCGPAHSHRDFGASRGEAA